MELIIIFIYLLISGMILLPLCGRWDYILTQAKKIKNDSINKANLEQILAERNTEEIDKLFKAFAKTTPQKMVNESMNTEEKPASKIEVMKEPIIAYRVWTVYNESQGKTIGSIVRANQKDYRCWFPGKSANSTMPIGFENNVRGIWACKDLEFLLSKYTFGTTIDGHKSNFLIYGKIALWGHIVEHEHGYRAQHAYPQMFFYDKFNLRGFNENYKKIADEWQIEWVPAPQILQDVMVSYYYKDILTDEKLKEKWSLEKHKQVSSIPILDTSYFTKNPTKKI